MEATHFSSKGESEQLKENRKLSRDREPRGSKARSEPKVRINKQLIPSSFGESHKRLFPASLPSPCPDNSASHPSILSSTSPHLAATQLDSHTPIGLHFPVITLEGTEDGLLSQKDTVQPQPCVIEM